MKHARLLFVLIFFLAQTSFAQAPITTNHKHTQPAWLTKRIRSLLQMQQGQRQPDAAAKNTSVPAERLIGHSVYDLYPRDSFTNYLASGLWDTSAIKYSGGRGSNFNFNTLVYEFLYNQTGFGYDYYFDRIPQILFWGISTNTTNANFFPDVRADSCSRGTYSAIDTNGHLTYTPYVTSSYAIYNAANKVTLFDEPLNMSYSIEPRTAYFYDAYGNNSMEIYSDYYAATASTDTSGIDVHFTDGSGRIREDSLSQPIGGPSMQPVFKCLYTYDLTGVLTTATTYQYLSSTWSQSSKFAFTYNPDHTVKTDSMFVFDYGSGWLYDESDSFGYTPGVNYYTYFQMNFYNDSTYPLVTERDIYSKHIALSGLPDTLYYSSYMLPYQLYPVYKQAFVYDAMNNPTTVSNYYYTITDSSTGAGYYNSTPEKYTHYYYETYAATEGAPDVNAAVAAANLYPNPTDGTITISRPDAVKGSVTTVTLTNILGQVVWATQLPWLTDPEQFSMKNLPAGTYILTINDQTARTTSTQKIIKL